MIAVAILAVLAACWPTCIALHEKWVDTASLGDTHGYLVAAVSAFLLWQANRGAARSTGPGAHWPVLALVGAGLVWVLGVRSGLVAVEFALVPVLLWLAIRAAAGPDAGRRSSFAVAYLYFAMPLWGIINPILQGGTVYVVRGLLRVVGIPSHFIGNDVQIPAGTFEIAGGCSGLHFFVVALAIGALMGEMRGDDWRGRLKLLLLAGALALICNWLRVFTIILAGHYTHMQHYLVAESHYGYGWVVFALAMVVFFVLERRIAITAPRADLLPGSVPAGTTPVRHTFRPVATVVVAMFVLASLQWLSARPAHATPLEFSPAPGSAFTAAEAASWQPVIAGADAHQGRRFASTDGDAVERHEYFFLNQKQGKELGGYDNDLAAGAQVLSARGAVLAGLPATLYETRDARGERWLVAVSYGVGAGRYLAPLPAQLTYALKSLVRLRSIPSTVTVWRAECRPDCAAAEQLLHHFVATTEIDLFRGPGP